MSGEHRKSRRQQWSADLLAPDYHASLMVAATGTRRTRWIPCGTVILGTLRDTGRRCEVWVDSRGR